eukprot:TRINITY_DN1632_c0_g1_i1.p1 TRINITY_DN1632_c0_g1~~TRINITY_DN1632_c0_g1_i1.p1  ORF type:complete len:215 (+),score=38.66 TRINITY_DN1632_c0_g1_i1:1-645(+)
MNYLLFTIFIILLISFSCFGHESKLVFQVEPLSEECYFLEINEQQLRHPIIIELGVMRGGLLDVLLEVYNPQNDRIYSQMYFEEQHRGTTHNFVAEAIGSYKVCMNNKMARWTAKVVSFQAKIGEGKEKHNPIKKEDIDPFHESLNSILNLYDRIISQQNYLKDREYRHTSTLESTYQRIAWFSFFESSVLILLGIVQIFFVRTWFSNTARIMI